MLRGHGAIPRQPPIEPAQGPRPGRIRRGLSHQGVRAVVAAELKRLGPTTVPAPAPSVPPALAEPFVDRYGVGHPLDPALRDRLKPGWRVMLDPVAVAEPPNDEALRKRSVNAQRVVGEARRLVETFAGRPLGGRILEIGCFDGSAAY